MKKNFLAGTTFECGIFNPVWSDMLQTFCANFADNELVPTTKKALAEYGLSGIYASVEAVYYSAMDIKLILAGQEADKEARKEAVNKYFNTLVAFMANCGVTINKEAIPYEIHTMIMDSLGVVCATARTRNNENVRTDFVSLNVFRKTIIQQVSYLVFDQLRVTKTSAKQESQVKFENRGKKRTRK